uniref:Nucleotide-diphospho-sugar transferase domain-containing protein n=1 Tax=Meloidogyne javanica TaxID=6303 RepID=A0A915M6P8_MELJA
MQQQDTFWRKNLFDINLEQKLGFDLLFDQIGYEENSKRAEWVNGANFYVKANKYTQEFFEAIASKLSHWYTPDMGIMIHQCHTWKTPHCEYIPHLIANSWEWMYTEQKNPPYIMQLDCETDGRKSDGRTCNKKAVHKAQQAMERGEVDIGKGPVRLSWGRFQFKVYWWLVDYILCTPGLGSFLKPYLPLVGYILMFTVA